MGRSGTETARGSSWNLITPTQFVRYPFSGLVERTLNPVAFDVTRRWVSAAAVSDYLVILATWVAIAAVVSRGRKQTLSSMTLEPMTMLCVASVGLAAIMGKADIWEQSVGFARVLSPLFLWLAMMGVARGRRWMLAPLSLVVVRVGVEIWVHLSGYRSRSFVELIYNCDCGWSKGDRPGARQSLIPARQHQRIQSAYSDNILNLELEIFRNLFVSIAEEMGIVLRRTSFSPNIKERRDYSCAVYDEHAETIAMGDHMPAHLGAMPYSVTEALKAHSLDPGDLVLLNDPFRGGTHLPDITSVSAVFAENQSRPAYYLATRAHHSDVGGMMPGSMPLATEIFQEGLRIPPVKLIRNNEMNEDILELILANVRTPQERRGDLGAQIAAHRVGERRLLEASSKYGAEAIAMQMAELKDYSERMMSARIGEIPDGDYEFEDFLDNDGFSADPIRIHCRLTVSGRQATVDYSGSAPQVRGGVNANLPVTTASTMFCFRCLIEDDIPFNAGMMRPVEIVTRLGSVVDARMPASVAGGNVETSQRIADVLLGALQKALPSQIPAASSGTMNNLTLGGTDPRSGRPFAYYETIAGAMGARPDADGVDATHTNMTNSLNTPVEAMEHLLPLRMRRYAVRLGSGGEGVHRGGDGVVREFELLTDTDIAILSERRERGPYGLEGGESGDPGRNLLNGRLISGKGHFRAKLGDMLSIETPGAGGYGKKASA